MAERELDKTPAVREAAPALLAPEHRVERAAGEFRRGAPVHIAAGAGDDVLALPAETARAATLRALRDICRVPGILVLTQTRAATLKIPLYTPEVAGLALSPDDDMERLRAIADPANDLEQPLKGPFRPVREALPAAAAAAAKLAKLGGLLPAAVIFPLSPASAGKIAAQTQIASVDAADIWKFEDRSATSLQLLGRARVPLEAAEEAELAVFRAAHGGPEHYAILIGAKDSKSLAPPGPVLARLHSECFTGDLLGSLRCDCGDQLRGAVRAIAAAGGGVLLYLAQEGRGIGLMNKLRAYRLQDQGFDTLIANERLGFAADERVYAIAARMLTLLGYRSVRLMTNNPEKISALRAAGIEVAERVAHTFPDNVHNRDYLKTKAESGHLL